MAVIYVINTCQISQIAIVVIEIKPGWGDNIYALGACQYRRDTGVGGAVRYLMPGHADLKIFFNMCKGFRRVIACSCLFRCVGKLLSLYISDDAVCSQNFGPVIAFFDNGNFIFFGKIFQYRAFDASFYTNISLAFGGGNIPSSPFVACINVR